jgi:hypothetical protein
VDWRAVTTDGPGKEEARPCNKPRCPFQVRRALGCEFGAPSSWRGQGHSLRDSRCPLPPLTTLLLLKIACAVVGDSGVLLLPGPLGPLMGLPPCASSIRLVTWEHAGTRPCGCRGGRTAVKASASKKRAMQGSCSGSRETRRVA